MRKLRGQYTTSASIKLKTPAGTYFGADVLEGFAADAEYLG